ncbi:rhodopsin, GQ-coupled [Eurytemora carolleeae]|uniref:rhodopsin, GQ-coupled n=1 Tax=Eurytemora carolleeae TaxID=1294199 RepID=UPI000C794BE2|nr:rhodopsin, GQ-coupled [Eurytemora carolleeae]|eukprot:XP_023344028.1 rhodopsin, GQ-coupled-like [Eurytemora affinis]
MRASVEKMYENSSNELDPAPPIVLFYLMGIWAMITGITGFLANVIAIFLFVTTKKLRTPFNFILMNLSVTELIISCTGNSLLAINSFNRQWMFSSQMCQANAFGMTYLGKYHDNIKDWVHRDQDRQFPLSTNFSSLVTLIFIWLYTLSCAVPPIFGWGQFSQNTLKVSCGVKWAQADQNPVEHISFVAYIYMLGFVIPVIIIFTSYLKIIRTVNMNKHGKEFTETII